MRKISQQEADEFLKKVNDIFAALLEDDTPETPTTPKFFVSGYKEGYGYISTYGPNRGINTNTAEDKIAISLGVYRTQEEAEKAFEKQKALVRLWKNADEKYYFRGDWENGEQKKWLLKYDHVSRIWECDGWSIYQYNFSLPYFATREDAENFIKENVKDLEIYRLN